MMRCRPGTVTHTAFATVPDQRCTASLSLALHRIRDTSPLLSAYGVKPGHDEYVEESALRFACGFRDDTSG